MCEICARTIGFAFGLASAWYWWRSCKVSIVITETAGFAPNLSEQGF